MTMSTKLSSGRDFRGLGNFSHVSVDNYCYHRFKFIAIAHVLYCFSKLIECFKCGFSCRRGIAAQRSWLLALGSPSESLDDLCPCLISGYCYHLRNYARYRMFSAFLRFAVFVCSVTTTLFSITISMTSTSGALDVMFASLAASWPLSWPHVITGAVLSFRWVLGNLPLSQRSVSIYLCHNGSVSIMS